MREGCSKKGEDGGVSWGGGRWRGVRKWKRKGGSEKEEEGGVSRGGG